MLKQEAWKLEAMHELKDMTTQLDDLLERGTPAPGDTAPEVAAVAEAAPAEAAAAGATVEEETREQVSRQEVNAQVSAMLDAEEAILDEELDVLRAQLSVRGTAQLRPGDGPAVVVLTSDTHTGRALPASALIAAF